MNENGMSNTKFVPKCIAKILNSLFSKHPSLDKIDRIYVNIKTRQVTIEVNSKHENILSRNDIFNGRKYLLNREAFDQVFQIIRKEK